jgi:hypothetical protein
MDALITAAARALVVGDALGALKARQKSSGDPGVECSTQPSIAGRPAAASRKRCRMGRCTNA